MYICELTTVNSIPTVVKTTHQSFHLVGITLARKMDAEDDEALSKLFKGIYRPLSNDTLHKIFLINYEDNYYAIKK